MQHRIRTTGAYVIRSAESRPTKVVPSVDPQVPCPVPTADDLALARVVQTQKRERKT
jgi:hypothetical protein